MKQAFIDLSVDVPYLQKGEKQRGECESVICLNVLINQNQSCMIQPLAGWLCLPCLVFLPSHTHKKREPFTFNNMFLARYLRLA